MKIIGLLTASAIALGAGTFSETITSNKRGEYGGFDYEFWREKNTDNASMKLGENGTFECSWEKAENVLFRTGKKLNAVKKTHEETGEISIEYGCDYAPKGTSYLCVYGWSTDPLIEFYIVESWGNWRPPNNKTVLGTIEVDGGTYEIFEDTRTNMPSIEGTKTFKQYWSVRTEKRTEGVISVSDHFKAWEEAGLNLGYMYEVSLCVEGYKSSGNAYVYKHNLLINGLDEEDISEPEETAPAPEPKLRKNQLFSTLLIGAGAALLAFGLIAAVIRKNKK